MGSSAGSDGIPGESRQGLKQVLAGSRANLDQIWARSVDLRMICLNSKNSLRFLKMETIFRKLKKNFRSIEKYFSLTIILRRTKH
jgi:hypothetical protein